MAGRGSCFYGTGFPLPRERTGDGRGTHSQPKTSLDHRPGQAGRPYFIMLFRTAAPSRDLGYALRPPGLIQAGYGRAVLHAVPAAT